METGLAPPGVESLFFLFYGSGAESFGARLRTLSRPGVVTFISVAGSPMTLRAISHDSTGRLGIA